MPKIDDLLRLAVRRKASDLHLTTSFPPYLRIGGDIAPIEQAGPITAEAMDALVSELMPERNRVEFAERWDTDFAYAIAEVGRFRVNVFRDRYGTGVAVRQIPSRVPTAEELGLPAAVREFCQLSKGLVVVTGPTGSGKSTTLAAMVDLVNRTRSDHLITIEDPVEFVHAPIRCLINQREVHTQTRSFASALRAALREDPDIVLVGEMRDLETMEIAMETAETGHLVFGTLHTNTAASTVDRMIDLFPAARQNQIRSMLADSLKGVIAQVLCRKVGGGRVAALEILVVTDAVAANIREGKTHYIPSAMQVGKRAGMQLVNDALLDLLKAGLITSDEAYLRAHDRQALAKKLREGGFALPSAVQAQAVSGAPPSSVVGDRALRDRDLLQRNREILRTDPNNVDALNTVAWMLATNPDAALRDGGQALELARRALAHSAGDARISVLDTLAAAQAETGDFGKALETAQQGLALAAQAKRGQAVSLLERGIALYREGQPFRDV